MSSLKILNKGHLITDVMAWNKVLVTGGAGFIGSHMVDALLRRGCDVVVYDNLSSGRREFLSHCMDEIEFLHSDLVKDKELGSYLSDIDWVFHVAANPDVRIGPSDTWTSVEQNIIATYNLLEAMRLSRPDDPAGISFTSTSTVYGNAKVLPTPEDYGPLMPISQYGASKLAAEALVSAFSDNFGIKSSVFRFANVVGSRSTHGILIDLARKLMADRTKVDVLGDGTQQKSYIHVSDCCEGVLHATEVQRTPFEYYNLGTDDWILVRDIVDVILGGMGLESARKNFTGGHKGAGWKGDVKFMSLSIDKIRATGWNYRYNTRQSLERALSEILSDIGWKGA
jgi:UDP-glucose 4-epimerase